MPKLTQHIKHELSEASFYFFAMLGGFILQPTFDITSDTDLYSAAEYRIALILLPSSLVVGTLLFKWLKENNSL